MFNGTLFQDSILSKSSQGVCSTDSGDHVEAQNKNPPQFATPFAIYEDNTEAPPGAAPFTIYCDENAEVNAVKDEPLSKGNLIAQQRVPLGQIAVEEVDKVSSRETSAPLTKRAYQDEVKAPVSGSVSSKRVSTFEAATDAENVPNHLHLPLMQQRNNDENDQDVRMRPSERKVLSLLPLESNARGEDNASPITLPASPIRESVLESRSRQEYKEPHLNDEDQENIPPKGYQQTKEKRSLAGILKASKDVYFVPLEEQNNAEENGREEGDVSNLLCERSS